jgi:hypothetical protein
MGKKRQQHREKEARVKDADIEGDTGLTAAALAAMNELLTTAKELYRSLGGGRRTRAATFAVATSVLLLSNYIFWSCPAAGTPPVMNQQNAG